MAASTSWLDETRQRAKSQVANVAVIASAEQLEAEALNRLDSSLKKLTSFMRKTKCISSTQPASSLISELEKLNVHKFLDEIAANIVEAKVKVSEVPDLLTFIVRLASLYDFTPLIINELKKVLPTKKTDKVENSTKLRVNLRLLAELYLNGVVGKPGLDLLGLTLSCITATDVNSYANVPVLMAFCRPLFFDFTGVVPFKEASKMKNEELQAARKLASPLLTDSNRDALINLFENYFKKFIVYLNTVRVKMNKIHKSIKRQERTKGDASQVDRQDFAAQKQIFDKLKLSAMDIADALNKEFQPMNEEPSDDELDEVAAKQLDNDLSEGKISLWADRDMMIFYESLPTLTRYVAAVPEVEEDDPEDVAADEKTTFTETVDSVEFGDLDKVDETGAGSGVSDDEEADERTEEGSDGPPAPPLVEIRVLDAMHKLQFVGTSMSTFMENLTSALNRELIDQAAVHFVQNLNKKINRKRLVQHFINSSRDRLDLLPFYARFLASIREITPDVTNRTFAWLLGKFRELAGARYEPPKKGEKREGRGRIVTEGIFTTKFLAELTKFKILPKPEALACLRSLLFDLRGYKVEMTAVFIESAGVFLYLNTETHAKMKVAMNVILKKITAIKDARQRILLENAYFAVIPPADEDVVVFRQDPLKAYISYLVRSISPRPKMHKHPTAILDGIDWEDPDIVDFLCSELANATSVSYDCLPEVADAVRALSDNHGTAIGITICDIVIEVIRVALETNKICHQQRLRCSVHYLNWLYICGVCDYEVVIHVLYQLISLGIDQQSYSVEQLLRRANRIRMASDVASELWEYVDPGFTKVQYDTFVHYLLYFVYSTQNFWAERADVLGDFPADIPDRVHKLIVVICGKSGRRRASRFARDLESAKRNIEYVERKYRKDVKRHVAQSQRLMQQGFLGNIQEENENENENEDAASEVADDDGLEDDDDAAAEDDEGSEDSESDDESEEPDIVEPSAPEELHVHIEKTYDATDDDFNRQLDRMLAEAMQTASSAPRQANMDLSVPPLARQKFVRKAQIIAPNDPINPPQQLEEEPIAKMALMTKGKGHKPILKAVHLEVSDSIKDAWNQKKRDDERERVRMKEITLQLNERIQQRADDEPVDPWIHSTADANVKPSECHIPAGPRRHRDFQQ